MDRPRRSTVTAAGRRDVLRLVLLGVGLCLLLTGCDGSGTPVTPVPPAVLGAILAYFVAQKHLVLTGNTRRAREHRHRAFFVWRRAMHLGERNAAWVAEANQTTLKQRIDSEYGAVEAYAARQLGTSGSPGPFGGGTDPIVPPHLDLADVARRYTTQTANSATVRSQARENVDDRRVFTSAIIWRAAAIHDDLWQPSPDGRSATLKQRPSPRNADDVLLNEILDRRLRTVERMTHNVSDNSVMGGSRWPAVIPNPHSGWRDGFRIRMFQYPRVPKNRQFDALLAGSTEWSLGERRTRYEYQVAQTDVGGRQRYKGLYFPPSQQPHWRAAPGSGFHQFLMPTGGWTPAQLIDDMFVPTPPNKWEDWWGRTWMWCDHVIAAIHLEALLLGKRRREAVAARKDDAFNAVATRSTGYASVGAFVGMASRAIDVNLLMADDDDPVFDNVVVPVFDLQVGDQLIFWNSFIYTMISTGDWRLENAFVMEINSDPHLGVNRRGNPPTLQLKLQGHGTASTLYGQYTQIIANKLIGAMRHVQQQIRDAVAATPGVTSVHYTERPNTEFVKWSPYEDFRSPGAWWIRIPQGQYGRSPGAWGFGTVQETVQGIQKAVGHDGGHVLNDGGTLVTVPVGPGYHSPPDTDSVYFPIFEPRVPGGWSAYLRGRAGSTTFRAPDRLNDLQVDGSIMPGLFYRGTAQPIPIVRPKVN